MVWPPLTTMLSGTTPLWIVGCFGTPRPPQPAAARVAMRRNRGFTASFYGTSCRFGLYHTHMRARLGVICSLLAMVNAAQSQTAADLTQEGHFVEALAACEAALKKNPSDFSSQLLEARLLVRMNHLKRAEAVLNSLADNSAATADQKKQIHNLLGETYYRQDRFKDSAIHFRQADKVPKATQLEDFANVKPNEISPNKTTADVKFDVTDPLPVLELTANGLKGRFIVDTGASEVVLDPEFAAKVGVKALSSQTGTFAGGKTASEASGRLDSLQMDTITVRNVPVHILNTKNFSPQQFGGNVDGIIGTILFYHFTTTIDYPNHQLVFAPRGKVRVDKDDVALPFWLMSDHLMVTWGKLGDSSDRLFLIDTGLAGAAFTGPKSITDEAGIKVSMENAQMGEGGAGKVQMSPYKIPMLSLGPVVEKDLDGVYGAFPDVFENSLGFHLCGIISHQFFRPYAVTFDFEKMQVILRKAQPVTKLSEQDVVFLTERDMPPSNLSLWFLLRNLTFPS